MSAIRKLPKAADIELWRKWILAAREDPVEVVCRQALRHRALKDEARLSDPWPQCTQSWELDQFQVDLVNAVADIWREKTVINHGRKTQISVVSGHGPGKTHTAALIAHVATACFPARVIITAPKFDQVKTRLFAAIHKIDMRAEPWYRRTHNLGETTAHWTNIEGGKDQNYCIIGETAKTPEALAGHHEQFEVVIVEEATGVPEALYPVIFSALSTGVIQILVMISNPTQRTGTFADSHLKAREAQHFFTYKIGFEQSRRVSRQWAERLISKYGKDSPAVKVRVFGEFASDEPGQLIAMQWITNARNKDGLTDGSIPRKRISIDCAGGGSAETIITLCDHHQSKVVARRMRRFSFELERATDQTADAAVMMWKDMGCGAANGDTFVVDSIGVGLGVAGELLKREYPVVFHQGGAKSSAPDRWRNQRVQSYMACRNALRDGLLEFDEKFLEDEQDWDDLEAQLCAIRTKDNGDRVEDLETKDELVLRLGFSPDMADSLAMQWSSMAPALVTGTQMSGSRADEVTTLAGVGAVLESAW